MLKEKLLEDMKVSMRDKNVIRKNVIQMVRIYQIPIMCSPMWKTRINR